MRAAKNGYLEVAQLLQQETRRYAAASSGAAISEE